MELVYENDRMWIVRKDGWHYRFDHIRSLDVSYGLDDDYGWSWSTKYRPSHTAWTVTVHRLSEAVLKELGVLLEFTNDNNIDLRVATD